MRVSRDIRNSSRAQAAFDLLEARLALSAVPQVHSLSILDPSAASAGRPITLSARVTDDVSVQAVTFFVDVNADNEWTPGIDRSLGDLFAPDVSTIDQYTYTFIADWDTPGAGSRIRFAANAMDGEGQWPVTAYTAEIDIYQRLIITQLLAEPLSSTQVQLTATVSAPFGVASTGMQGVTFWYDANGNNAFDAGIDTDLGYTQVAHGGQQRDFTITPTINPLWAQPLHFAAAARDLRASADGFGVPHTGILRQNSGPGPALLSASILPEAWPVQHDLIAGDMADVSVLWNTADVTAFTLFLDVNRNGVWDHTIDQSLRNIYYTPAATASGQTVQVQIDKAWGSGLMALGAAIRTNPALGADAWSPVTSMYFVTEFAAWVKPPLQSTLSASASQPVTIDVTARDDYAVRTLTAFIDMDHDGQRGPADILLTDLSATSRPNRTQVNYRLAFTAPSSLGVYTIGFYATDYALPGGPVTFMLLNVI